jgi:coenzyme F420-reducing hydrogenase beta subunit
MDNITKQGINHCCGCGVCAVACAQKAIIIKRCADGFYAPIVDNKLCNNCGVCQKICYKYLKHREPFKNAFEDKAIYGAWSKNQETVMTCSSGGVGFELTSYFYDNGYKVCGCAFDAPNDNVKHIIARSRKDLEDIKTSKYLQSYTVDAFSQFKKDEKYLVIGCPCQIYGLRKYICLKGWEDNCILVDFFCAGTPTFNLWLKYKDYLKRIKKISAVLQKVNFRFKSDAYEWHNSAIALSFFGGGSKRHICDNASSSNLFFNFFLNHSCQNTSCYQCQLRLDKCASDIRIADFWGSKYADRKDGVSLVITNTQKGEEVWKQIKEQFNVEKCALEDLLNSQPCRFCKENKRDITLKELQQETTLEEIYNKYHRFPLNVRTARFAKQIIAFCLKKFFGKKIFNKIKWKIYGKQ